VGTDKRERQKANRQLRLEEMAKAQQQQKFKRRGLLIGGGIAAAVLLAFLFSIFGSDDDGEAQSTTTAAAAVDPTDTTVAVSTAPVSTSPVSAAPVSTVPPAPTVPGVAITGETPCPPDDGSAERTITFEQPPPMCIDETKSYTAEIETNVGPMTVELDATKAPNTVNNFVVLARYHYFDGIVCHRAIPGFVVQCGDPDGTGSGGPGYEFGDELPSEGEYAIGSLAMANSGPNTNGSQFFIITGESGAALPADYTLFGQVTEGLDTTVKELDALGNPDPASNGVPPLGLIQIDGVTITES
jgi:cyclophilin family peptidyl-prolyl cis-trans isomerase